MLFCWLGFWVLLWSFLVSLLLVDSQYEAKTIKLENVTGKTMHTLHSISSFKYLRPLFVVVLLAWFLGCVVVCPQSLSQSVARSQCVRCTLSLCCPTQSSAYLHGCVMKSVYSRSLGCACCFTLFLVIKDSWSFCASPEVTLCVLILVHKPSVNKFKKNEYHDQCLSLLSLLKLFPVFHFCFVVGLYLSSFKVK